MKKIECACCLGTGIETLNGKAVYCNFCSGNGWVQAPRNKMSLRKKNFLTFLAVAIIGGEGLLYCVSTSFLHGLPLFGVINILALVALMLATGLCGMFIVWCDGEY